MLPRTTLIAAAATGLAAPAYSGNWSFSEHPHAGGTCHGHGGVQRYV